MNSSRSSRAGAANRAATVRERGLANILQRSRSPRSLTVAALFLYLSSPGFAQNGREEAFIGARGRYWAFQKVVRPPVPTIRDPWIRNPIDAFILDGLRQKQLAPSNPLDRTLLIRRVTYDLTGLPPLPADVAAFLNDKSPDAYGKVVDRLLASPQYGERWAGKWLDVVRYADTNGFELDLERPHAWRYRDYVIQSFNAGKPYDRFIREQIAGDELYPDNLDARIAVAFNRHYTEETNQPVLELRRQEILNDITDTVGAVFLGMTYGCARCHDHKFDPILHKDYYRLQAFFANVHEDNHLNLLTGAEQEAYNKKYAE